MVNVLVWASGGVAMMGRNHYSPAVIFALLQRFGILLPITASTT